MSEAYVRMLEDQIDQLTNDMSRKNPDYIRGNKNYILYGIIDIFFYLSVLEKNFNTSVSYINSLFMKMANLIHILNYQEPNIVLPDFFVQTTIISLLMDSIVEDGLGSFVEENIRSRLLPIDLSDSGNFKNNRDGSILNDTENIISNFILSNVEEITIRLNMYVLEIIRRNEANKNFFKILLALMISIGHNTDITPITQLFPDSFFLQQPQQPPQPPQPPQRQPQPPQPQPQPQPRPPRQPQPPPTVEQIDDTQEYATQLVERIRCPICLINERHIALNCGHTICSECAQNTSLINCPECRKPITQKIKIYYNKYLKYKTKYAQLKKLNKEF